MSRARQPGAAARFRRRRLLGLAVLVVLLAAGVGFGGRALLLGSARFAVAKVVVLGAVEVAPAAIRAASGIRTGVPLLAVDLEGAQRGVAALPSVASVRAGRHWPDTVELQVSERAPVALAASAGGPRLVDGTGVAYRAAPTPSPPLPRLAAARVAPDDPATRAGLAVLATLPAAVRAQVQVVEAAGPSAVTLRLAGGKTVRWGDADDAARKAEVLAVLLSQRGSAYDVSAPDLPTIRR